MENEFEREENREAKEKFRLYRADAFDVLPRLESAFFDMTLTSVPFSAKDMGPTVGEYWARMDVLYAELIRITRKIVIINQSAVNMNEYARRYDPLRALVWIRGRPFRGVPGYSLFFVHRVSEEYNPILKITRDCFDVPAIKKYGKRHPYEDPEDLYREIISMFAGVGNRRSETCGGGYAEDRPESERASLKTDMGGVLDPFMGSGTTGAACAALGLHFTGIEKNADYYEIARKRIEKAYGKKR